MGLLQLYCSVRFFDYLLKKIKNRLVAVLGRRGTLSADTQMVPAEGYSVYLMRQKVTLMSSVA
jgi:hypothetical protein